MVFLFKRIRISRRIDSYNLREEIPKYDDISDEALDCVVSTVLHDFFKGAVSRQSSSFCLILPIARSQSLNGT